jgi:general secretion pathway protein B
VVEEPISEPPVAAVPEPAREAAAIPEPVAPPEPVESRSERAEEPAAGTMAADEMPAAEELPRLRDMPPEFRRSLPELKMDAHFHTDVPGRSFVMINLRKYKPGERLAEGPLVVEIVPEGAVLSHQGQQFLLTP